MNLIVIPFHDWRKIQREGERTRDAHLIRELANSDLVDSILVVNRPISFAEMAYKRTWWKTKGTVIHSDSRGRLVQVAPKLYVLDTLDRSIFSPITQGKAHFFDCYSSDSLRQSVDWNRHVLGMNDAACISFNVYAAGLFDHLDCELRHFDAWDNFLRFPANSRLQPFLKQSYTTYARTASSWSTNSEENRTYFDVLLGKSDCTVIRNGVSPEIFQASYPIPPDLAAMPRPVVGMGMKVTHLLDANLLNQVIWSNPGVTFVLIGQILDRPLYDRIRKVSNFHYLGDKHYQDYPAYVTSFDACIIPYCTGDKQHGGDAIKFYEYLAANKPVISTPGNGVTDDFEAVWLESSPTRFSEAVQAALTFGPVNRQLPENIRWSCKAGQLLSTLTRSPQSEEVYVL